MTALHRRGSKLRCVGLPPRGMVRSPCLTYNTEYPRTPTGPDGHSPFDHLEFAAQSSQRSGSASCSEASSRTPSSPSCFDQSRWNQYAPSCEGLRARREEPCAASICGGVAGSYEIPREGGSAPTSQDGTTHSTMVSIVVRDSIVDGHHRVTVVERPCAARWSDYIHVLCLD